MTDTAAMLIVLVVGYLLMLALVKFAQRIIDRPQEARRHPQGHGSAETAGAFLSRRRLAEEGGQNASYSLPGGNRRAAGSLSLLCRDQS